MTLALFDLGHYREAPSLDGSEAKRSEDGRDRTSRPPAPWQPRRPCACTV